MHDSSGQPVYVDFHNGKDAYCVGCGYNLRGTSGNCCPECGTGFYLAMPQPAANYGLYLLGLIGTGALVFENISLVFWIVASVRGYVSFMDDPIRVVGHVFALAAIPYLVVLIRGRERITRSGLQTRILFAFPPSLILLIILLYSLYRAVTL